MLICTQQDTDGILIRHNSKNASSTCGVVDTDQTSTPCLGAMGGGGQNLGINALKLSYSYQQLLNSEKKMNIVLCTNTINRVMIAMDLGDGQNFANCFTDDGSCHVALSNTTKIGRTELADLCVGLHNRFKDCYHWEGTVSIWPVRQAECQNENVVEMRNTSYWKAMSGGECVSTGIHEDILVFQEKENEWKIRSRKILHTWTKGGGMINQEPMRLPLPQPLHPCEVIIGSVSTFLDQIIPQLTALGIDIEDKEIDHVCYRCDSSDSYLHIVSSLEKQGAKILESMIAGRPIASVVLTTPIVYHSHKIPIIEVASAKVGNYESSTGQGQGQGEEICHRILNGLEHCEVVIGKSGDSPMHTQQALRDFMQTTAENNSCSGIGTIKWDKKALGKELNADVSLEMKIKEPAAESTAAANTSTNTRIGSVKFHVCSLHNVCKYERAHHLVEPVPADYWENSPPERVKGTNIIARLPL